MNPDYQTVYGVGLLDDLHNYFPAFLYDNGRFQTLPQAFSYFRSQMNARFNLLSYGASLHRAAAPSSPLGAAPAPRSRDDLAADVASLNFLTSILGSRDPRPFGSVGLGLGLGAQARARGVGADTDVADIWAIFTDPVPIRPSQEVLAANTEILLGSSPQNCSICQDTIGTTEECRRLKPCQHVYHRTCIDQWFLRSVVCPTCRHDIRVALVDPVNERVSVPP
jgi:hypothetical protein